MSQNHNEALSFTNEHPSLFFIFLLFLFPRTEALLRFTPEYTNILKQKKQVQEMDTVELAQVDDFLRVWLGVCSFLRRQWSYTRKSALFREKKHLFTGAKPHLMLCLSTGCWARHSPEKSHLHPLPSRWAQGG